MDILKQLQRQAEQVEVVEIQDEKTTVEFQANQLKSSAVAETRGVAVRVVRGGRLGFAASSDLQALDQLAAHALESASYGDPVALRFPAAQAAPAVRCYDARVAELPVARLVEMGKEILETVLPAEPEGRCSLTIERSVSSTQIRNQAGLELNFQRSPLSFALEILRVEGDDVLDLFMMAGLSVWTDDFGRFARELAEKLKRARTITKIKPGVMPVIFSPTGSLGLAIPLYEGLNGKAAYKGTSPLIGKNGQKLFDEKLSVFDDATIEGQIGSASYDDEGVPHRRSVLIENGVFQDFVYDLKTAAQFGVESTGNASRNLFNPPSPAISHFILQPGATPLHEMIAGIDEGLLAEDLLGLGQGNVISGAFSNPLGLAYKIEKGEIVGRVKDVSIAGNVYDLLKNVAAVSQESEWVYNSFRMPSLLLPEINVVAQG